MVLFFLVAFLITAVFVYVYSQSFKLTVIPLACSLIAVIWQLGLLTLLGFGIDPMSILVPFLVFAIGVSHGVQMVSAYGAEVYAGADSDARGTRRPSAGCWCPGGVALLSDTIGFITIMLIKIRMIQEMAITASLGVAVIILTNLVLVPVLLSYIHFDEIYALKLKRRHRHMDPAWNRLARVAEPRSTRRSSRPWRSSCSRSASGRRPRSRSATSTAGVPELRADSRYNIDTDVITDHFSIGVDVIAVIVEAAAGGLHRLRDHDHHRPLRVAHAQRARGAVGDRHRRRSPR